MYLRTFLAPPHVFAQNLSITKPVLYVFQVKTGKVIGVGDFGNVLLAEAKKLLPDQKKTVVVVKQLKTGASEQEKQDFLRPVEAMK